MRTKREKRYVVESFPGCIHLSSHDRVWYTVYPFISSLSLPSPCFPAEKSKSVSSFQTKPRETILGVKQKIEFGKDPTFQCLILGQEWGVGFKSNEFEKGRNTTQKEKCLRDNKPPRAIVARMLFEGLKITHFSGATCLMRVKCFWERVLFGSCSIRRSLLCFRSQCVCRKMGVCCWVMEVSEGNVQRIKCSGILLLSWRSEDPRLCHHHHGQQREEREVCPETRRRKRKESCCVICCDLLSWVVPSHFPTLSPSDCLHDVMDKKWMFVQKVMSSNGMTLNGKEGRTSTPSSILPSFHGFSRTNSSHFHLSLLYLLFFYFKRNHLPFFPSLTYHNNDARLMKVFQRHSRLETKSAQEEKWWLLERIGLSSSPSSDPDTISSTTTNTTFCSLFMNTLLISPRLRFRGRKLLQQQQPLSSKGPSSLTLSHCPSNCLGERNKEERSIKFVSFSLRGRSSSNGTEMGGLMIPTVRMNWIWNEWVNEWRKKERGESDQLHWLFPSLHDPVTHQHILFPSSSLPPFSIWTPGTLCFKDGHKVVGYVTATLTDFNDVTDECLD